MPPIEPSSTRATLEGLIAEQLRAAIERRQLTQVDAAVILQTSVKHLNQVLLRRAHPSLKTLEQWSDRLGLEWQVVARDVTQKSDRSTRRRNRSRNV